MIKCLYCGEELKKITSIGLEVGNFFLKEEERKRKISISFGNKKNRRFGLQEWEFR